MSGEGHREAEAREAWHARYDNAIASGKDPAEAVAAADTTPEQVVLAKRENERREAVCIIVPRHLPVATALDYYAPPSVMEYDEVWLSPHELRRVATRKLAGEQL